MSETDIRREPTQSENTLEWYCKRAADNAIASYRAALKKKIEGMKIPAGKQYDSMHHMIQNQGWNEAISHVLEEIDQTTIEK